MNTPERVPDVGPGTTHDRANGTRRPTADRRADGQHPTLRLQQQIGNRSVGKLLSQQTSAAPVLIQRKGEDLFGDRARTAATGRVEGVRDAALAKLVLDNPTWDPEAIVNVDGKETKGGWVEATEARNAPGSSSGPEGSRVDKRIVAGTEINPEQINQHLAAGTLSEEELQQITPQQVAQVNPLGEEPRKILKNALHESWHHAKETLLKPGGNVAAREMLMAKLWEFRQWHHDVILRRTQADPAIGKEGLTEWKAAGSTTLTSDIDVNLKGSKTEQAVAVFNRLFKADGWSKEAGVVYDVNVYALDMMHADTFKGLADTGSGVERHNFSADASATRVSAKEGARSGSSGGGVSSGNAMLAERMKGADTSLQNVWSLVKMRLYMTGTEWQEYVTGASVAAETVSAVDLRYDSYMDQLKKRMAEGTELLEVADEAGMTGFEVLDAVAQSKAGAEGDGEDVKMAASNRIYEQRLVEMSQLRAHVKSQIVRYEALVKAGEADDAEMLDAAIDGSLAMLRDLISECAMFSNEAYVTDGAINHAVVGLQSKIGIAQTRSETMDAFNENVGDALKEIKRHSATIGEAAYKAGKYLWRMADAARNLGNTNADILELYHAGYTLANEIKGGSRTQAQNEAAAAEVLQRHLGADAADPDSLMKFVRRLATVVANEHSEDLAANGGKRALPVTAARRA